MKNFARKAALTVVTVVATLGLVAVSAPADAKDTGWGWSSPLD